MEESDLPWHTFTSPVLKFQEMPTLVVGELAFITLAFSLLLHSFLSKSGSRWLWLSALVAGTANDCFFMALPGVDNFWQAQTCLMLTPRLPFYIPCVYVSFLYSSSLLAKQLIRAKLGSAILAGFVAIVVYGPYDLLGVRMLWWTWHNSDLAVANRLLGVPIGSSMWVITYSATFAFLTQVLHLDQHRRSNIVKQLGRIVVLSLGSILIMMLQMALIQLICFEPQGIPSCKSLITLVVIYVSILLYSTWVAFRQNNREKGVVGFKKGPRNGLKMRDYLMTIPMTLYFIVIITLALWGRPEHHRSEGLHQTLGPCDTEEIDLAGHTRLQYLCAEDHSNDFWNLCEQQSTLAKYKKWYSICGKVNEKFVPWITSILAFCSIGIALFSPYYWPSRSFQNIFKNYP